MTPPKDYHRVTKAEILGNLGTSSRIPSPVKSASLVPGFKAVIAYPVFTLT